MYTVAVKENFLSDQRRPPVMNICVFIAPSEVVFHQHDMAHIYIFLRFIVKL